MLERVVEHWLDSASERSFQLPFCYMLAKKGHTVVHLTRHCGMELGKDVLTIGPDGTPCAFQLKNGNLTLSQWQNHVVHQVQDLVAGSIVHPAIDESQRHQPYLVINGKVEEEVARAIGDQNKTWQSIGLPEIKLWVRGELLAGARDLKSDLWPTELTDVKTLLELRLEDGREVFPKEKLSVLLESTLPLQKKNGQKKAPSKAACKRALSSAALLTALGATNFVRRKNHVAEIEAWTVYVSYAFALVEKWNLGSKYYEDEVRLALKAIKNALANLVFELKQRNHLVETPPVFDQSFYGIRVTWVIALASLYGIWRILDQDPKDELDYFIKEFTAEHEELLNLWGEAAVPQFLAYIWYYRITDGRMRPDGLLWEMIRTIAQRNNPRSNIPLPNPYYEAKDLLPYWVGSQLDEVMPDALNNLRVSSEPLDTNFAGYSYTLIGLVYIFVKRNWKQTMKALWPSVTKVFWSSFDYEEEWHCFRWHNEEGQERVTMPKPTRRWDDLKKEAHDDSGSGFPDVIKEYPVFALLFLCVFPHRLNSSIVRWLDTVIRKEAYNVDVTRRSVGVPTDI